MELGIVSGIIGLGALSFTVLVLWSLVWKGWALWIAARKGSKFWFILLLVLNTAGILDILYIFFFSERDFGKKLDKKVDGAVEKVRDAVEEKVDD